MNRRPDPPGQGAAKTPLPFTEFIVKVHARCDLACDYCYMYTPRDSSWRSRPPVIAPATVSRFAERVADHVERHGLDRISLLLHGGEPLLAGPGVLRGVVEAVRGSVGRCEVSAGIQTNGLRLTAAHVDLFAELGIGVGLSLDGAAPSHDRHRRDRRGRGSHAATVRALDLLKAAGVPGLFAGLLCVVDLDADPLDTIRALLEHEPPMVDLLLPHASWSAPPARAGGPAGGAAGGAGADYGVWLATVFDYWYGLRPPAPGVRLFEEILVGLVGGPSGTEAVGLSPSGAVVVETDGTIEQVDSLKAVYPGAAATGLDVFRHSFDTALEHPGIRARRRGFDGLAPVCRQCRVGPVCGGGYYPHRYREGSGFAHPSVYCDDLFHLIGRIRERIEPELSGRAPRSGPPDERR
jgi:uncharacterized protein